MDVLREQDRAVVEAFRVLATADWTLLRAALELRSEDRDESVELHFRGSMTWQALRTLLRTSCDDNWDTLARLLDADALTEACRTLTLVDNMNRYHFGNQPAAVLLHRALAARYPELEPEVSRWIVAHRRSEKLPFGTVNHLGAATLAELATARASAAAVDQARQEQTAAEVRVHHAACANERLPNAVRRGDLAAVKALAAMGANLQMRLPDGRTLHDIARGSQRTKVLDYLQEIAPE